MEITNWLVSKTLTGPFNLQGFAMWYFEKRADGDNSIGFCWPFLLGVISSCTSSLFENQERLSLVLESVMNDFLRFIAKPRDWRRVITSWVFFTASSTVAAKRRKSSRYVRTQMAFLLRNAATGFKNFVKHSGGRTKAEWKSFNLVTCSLPNEAKELLGKTCDPGQEGKHLLNLCICHKISW